jgi:hypothetical protein
VRVHEKFRLITLSIPAECLQAIDSLAERQNKLRNDILRDIIMKDRSVVDMVVTQALEAANGAPHGQYVDE